MNKAEALKKIDELFKFIENEDKGKVWIPGAGDTYYYYEADEGLRKRFTISADPDDDFCKSLLVQKIYQTGDSRDANLELDRFISDMLKKYGYIEDHTEYRYYSVYKEWHTCEANEGKLYELILHDQQHGAVMHIDSTEEEREKMVELIKKSNKHLTN